MMSFPFSSREPLRPTIVQRILGRPPPDNALVEVINLLAERSPDELPGREFLENVGRRYRVDIVAHFGRELEALYREFLTHCLTDRHLSDREIEAAARLAAFLGLKADRCAVLQRQVTRKVYLRSVEQVLDDGRVDPEERAFLAGLRAHLQIPDDEAENMLKLRWKQSGRQAHASDTDQDGGDWAPQSR